MQAAGIAPGAAFSPGSTQPDACVNIAPTSLHAVCTDVAVQALLSTCQVLSPAVREKLMEVPRGASLRYRPSVGRSSVTSAAPATAGS
jgi:hypothetical protein